MRWIWAWEAHDEAEIWLSRTVGSEGLDMSLWADAHRRRTLGPGHEDVRGWGTVDVTEDCAFGASPGA